MPTAALVHKCPNLDDHDHVTLASFMAEHSLQTASAVYLRQTAAYGEKFL